MPASFYLDKALQEKSDLREKQKQERIERVVNLYNQGIPIGIISKRFKIGYDTVRRWLLANNIKLRQEGSRETYHYQTDHSFPVGE